MNYTLTQIAKVTGGKLYGSDSSVTNITIDSREALLSDKHLFVALSGVGRSGHNYITKASEAGVKAFLVERLPNNWESLGSFILCSDTLTALQSLATFHRSTFKGEVVAITGSNGKTTVKEWFSQLWPARSRELFRSPRSYNSQIGVALSLLMARGDESVVVIEAGISKCGEMERLQRMVRPTIGILTNIGDAHSENFCSNSQKLEQKLELFSELSKSRVIRGDKEEFQTIEEQNIWLVNQIYRVLGIEPLRDVELLPLGLRLEVQQGLFDSIIINDSYSNDLESLSAALDFASRESQGMALNLILTDIEQSAIDGRELYSRVAELATSHNVAHIICIGSELMAHRELFTDIPAEFYLKTKHALEAIEAAQFAGSVVLIKGARSFRTERISSRLEERTHTTTLEVNLSKLIDNLKYYQSHFKPSTKVMAMVKASSYGLGAVSVSRTLLSAGVESLAVAYADEGIALRRAGINSEIVVLNSDPGCFRSMVEHSLEPEIYSLSSLRSYIKEITRVGITSAPIHIKIDSGMHRLGFMEDEIDGLIEALKSQESLRVSTIFTHLAAADDPNEDDFTRSQIELFDRMASKISSEIGYSPRLSIANSAATIRFPEAHRDMVRLGIGLYEGCSTLRSKITQIKHIEAGESIGYNRRTYVDRDSRIATLPIGYADGIRRELGNSRLRVLVNGIHCSVVGNICMDSIMVDITDCPSNTKEGDVVTIIGGGAASEGEIAQTLRTISYEVLTAISPRIKRLYTW